MFLADCWRKGWNDFSIILKSQTTTEENIDSTIRYLKAVPFIDWNKKSLYSGGSNTDRVRISDGP